jgi:GR25 family glycosyltransferase involved in LPS biosynthesis
MTLLDTIFYINLEKRKDRLAHVQEELAKLGISGERVCAIETADGAIGCTLSHIQCLEMAKQRNLPHVFICEDDITFLNPELLLTNVERFEKSGLDWEVLIIGGNNAPPYTQISNFCIQVSNNQTTTGYIVKRDFAEILLNNIKESIQLLQDGVELDTCAIDQYWKRLQDKHRFYYYQDIYAGQLVGYSSIENRNVNYNERYLNQT